ncbi:MAG: branched-chain amino acid ABC transporter permease [Erysipelotrichaceae bacterium]|nr:branched-chain amino acid ABC transporter permease [Erysipelotrichaceae bacterium]MBR3227200.1 branched-chain amino acid ABC transporter permease [Erysipelotrichaceae bacterium]
MSAFIGAVVNGLVLGMAYALIAVGYSLVFGILRLINFAHGAIYAFGAYMVYFFVSLNFGLFPAIAIAVLLSGILALLVDKITLEPLRKKNSKLVANLITTVGVSFIIQNILSVEYVFGSDKKVFPSLNLFPNIRLGNLTIQSSQIIMFVVAIILLLIMTFIVQKTKIGLAMRATEQNTKAAKLMGVNVNFVISFTFFLGGASAAIAGALIGGYYQVISPTMGSLIALKAFAAAVVGGIGILYGSVVGGLVVGVSECLAAQFIGSNVRDPMAFVILILILIIKPNGLFGKKQITKV